ncbi:MAG: hypothetical protein K6C08_02050 [Oscillospiraceae bacterium]|nr:hypothetical protein [Oscillospiraceae bacterium]
MMKAYIAVIKQKSWAEDRDDEQNKDKSSFPAFEHDHAAWLSSGLGTGDRE